MDIELFNAWIDGLCNVEFQHRFNDGHFIVGLLDGTEFELSIILGLGA